MSRMQTAECICTLEAVRQTLTAVSFFIGREIFMKKDFIFGMNIHNCGYEAYPHDTLERNLAYCKDMNINLIRLNRTPFDAEGLAYVKEVAAAVHAKGMKIMLCCDWGGVCEKKNTPEEYYEGFKYVAENLKGEIDYYQV